MLHIIPFILITIVLVVLYAMYSTNLTSYYISTSSILLLNTYCIYFAFTFVYCGDYIYESVTDI